MPLDASRWTPKGETNGLSTLYVQKAYEFDVGHTVYVFCGRRVKISIIHNYNLTENFGAVGISFRLLGGGYIFINYISFENFKTPQIVENPPPPKN